MFSFSPKNIAMQYWPQSIVEIIADVHTIGWTADVQPLWQVHALMARLFSGRYRGSGRPFINHLAGTAALAMRHGASLTLVLAGYGHAAYEQGEFGRAQPGASKANQKEVSKAVGDAAAALIADYAGFDWSEFAKHRSIDATLVLSDHDKRLLFLHIVNELDDSFDYGVFDAAWREGCLARLAAGAKFATALAYPSLADQLRTRISYIRCSGLAAAKDTRPKQSETILNPSSKPRRLLKLTRRLVRFSNNLRGG